MNTRRSNDSPESSELLESILSPTTDITVPITISLDLYYRISIFTSPRNLTLSAFVQWAIHDYLDNPDNWRGD